MDCERNLTVLAVSQSPGNFFIFWNVIVPLSVLPSMLHFGLRKHEILLFTALLLNPYLLELISQYHILSWITVIFLVVVVYNVCRRWPWYNIYSQRFFFKLFILTIFLAIPDMIISYTWASLCKGIYNIVRNVDKSLKPDQITGYGNSVLLIGSSLLLLHAMYFHRMYQICACKFWMESPQNRCVKPRPERCKASQLSFSWKWLRNSVMKTVKSCRN